MDYYTNSGQKWTTEEEEKVINEYNNLNLDINEIGLIHRRTPGGISARLAILGIIPDRHSGKGYDKYTQTDLYKEICSNNRERKKRGRKTKIEKKALETIKREEEYQKNITFWENHNNKNSFICIKEKDYLDLKEELSDVKNELKVIKNMIKELAIYEFDD